MIILKEITHKNICECIYDTKTTEEQKAFVASNVESLAEACVRVTNGGYVLETCVQHFGDGRHSGDY